MIKVERNFGLFTICLGFYILLSSTTVVNEPYNRSTRSVSRRLFEEDAQTDSWSANLLTIFTTFTDTPDKYFVHRNIIINWGHLSPRIQPILFSNFSKESRISRLARQHGWILHQLPVSNQPPAFKRMYRLAYRLTKSTFYGFCNGDILFDNGLVETLETIEAKYSAHFNSTLVIGRRINVPINETTDDPLFEHHILNQRAKEFGQIASEMVEDYFFIGLTESFPWHTLRNIVIGRPGYDNYVVGQAISGNVSVIDATDTILAVHQTGKDGNWAGHHGDRKNREYNYRIIGQYIYSRGRTDKSQYVSIRDLKGQVYIHRRIYKRKVGTDCDLFTELSIKGSTVKIS